MSDEIHKKTPKDKGVDMTILRYCKSVLVLFIGIFALLVGWNNIADYGSNWAFVQHVMTMDTTFPGNALMGRAIHNEMLQRFFYLCIMGAEILTGILCLIGGYRMVRAADEPAPVFNRSKGFAFVGMTLGFVLWFFGFMTVGAEWFLMWQSPSWNGQEAAFRFITCIGLVFILVAMHDDDPR